jgi:hypothetical protein
VSVTTIVLICAGTVAACMVGCWLVLRHVFAAQRRELRELQLWKHRLDYADAGDIGHLGGEAYATRGLPAGAAAAQPSTALPVVQGDPDKLCRTCKHFDLEEGQALAQIHGPFMMAAQFVPPSEMGAVATPEGEIPSRDIPAKATWDQFGFCRHRSDGEVREGVWGPTDATRRARMKGDDGEEGSFLDDDDGIDCYVA